MIEYKGGTPTQNEHEDVFNSYDLCTVLLYNYEWKISNISMIKSLSKSIVSPLFSVGPCKNFDWKIRLTSTGHENIQVEIHLIKDCRLSKEMKAREANCPLTSKLKKYTLRLEFLDNCGNIISDYKTLPYEFKLINTSVVYVWAIEENVTPFIHDGTLTIRAKLAIGFYSDSNEKDVACSNKTAEVLTNDMKNFFNDRRCSADILIKIGSQYVPCHKPIIYSQYPHFDKISKTCILSTLPDQCVSPLKPSSNVSDAIGSNCEVLPIFNENVDVFLSVLYFIYTKKLHSSETVDDFAVYEFAKKYGIRDLSMLLMPTEIKVNSKIIVKNVNYTWYVKHFTSFKDSFSSTESPEFKTEIGNEVITWNVTLSCSGSMNLILNLKDIGDTKSNVQISIKMGVYNADGSIYDEREFKYLFISGIINNCFSRLPDSLSPFCINSDLLYNDTLAVYCDLTVTCGDLSSDIKYYSSEHPAVDLTCWINNFQKLLESEIFSDATLIVEENEFKVHRAILAARSPVFSRMFENDMAEKRSGCVRIKDASSEIMQKALYYIYTCKVDNLTLEHAPSLYCVADKYALDDLKSMCADFILRNLDTENACEVLVIADLYGDETLKKAAKQAICLDAAHTLLSSDGIELLSNYTPLAHDILETLSATYRTLKQ